MKEYIVTGSAQKDIKQIAEYIAIDNLTASIKLTKSFYETFERLSKMPESGYIRPEWSISEKTRFSNVKKYIIVYKINEDEKSINILRVLSTYRNIRRLMN